MDTKSTYPTPNVRPAPVHLPEVRLGNPEQATAAAPGPDPNTPICQVRRVDTDEATPGSLAAERLATEQVSLITAALETLRLAPNADTFVREALGTIVARLGGCGGALWTVGAGLHDTRIATDYDRGFECFRSGDELEDDHPGKRSQPFPPEVVERWRRHEAEPVLIPAGSF